MNPSQKMPTFNRGQALPADALNHVVEAVKRMIQEGKGIHIERAGDQIVIHAKGGPIPTGGGGGVGDWIEAAAYEHLPFPEVKKIAYIYTGPQKGQIYTIGFDLTDTAYWKCLDETYEAETKAGLTNNEYVQKFAVGRVGAIYYRRNEDNDGWEAQNEFE